MDRDWKIEAQRLLSEDCQIHREPYRRHLGRLPLKACCPRYLEVALRLAYEAGRADERAERERREP